MSYNTEEDWEAEHAEFVRVPYRKTYPKSGGDMFYSAAVLVVCWGLLFVFGWLAWRAW